MSKSYYCRAINGGIYHYKSELPKTLREFVDYQFSSGGYIGDYFKSFDRKFHNAIKKMLPDGYTIHTWHRNHYESTAVIKDNEGRFIYAHISDVRYWMNEWFTSILIRTMSHDQDWHGGANWHTNLVDFKNDIQKLWR